MKWSKTPPTKPGAYHWRSGRGFATTFVNIGVNGSAMFFGNGRCYAPAEIGGEWGDEIPAPAPESWVPMEEGWYFATSARSQDDRLAVSVYLSEDGDGNEMLIANGSPLSVYRDWSERLTDPGPKKAE